MTDMTSYRFSGHGNFKDKRKKHLCLLLNTDATLSRIILDWRIYFPSAQECLVVLTFELWVCIYYLP